MYYPGVSNINRATIIAIEEGQHLEDYNLVLNLRKKSAADDH
jgi:hypothetical protein